MPWPIKRTNWLKTSSSSSSSEYLIKVSLYTSALNKQKPDSKSVNSKKFFTDFHVELFPEGFSIVEIATSSNRVVFIFWGNGFFFFQIPRLLSLNRFPTVFCFTSSQN